MTMTMTRKATLPALLFAIGLVLAGCATVGGAAVGGSIGYLYGDARMGAAVGATTGAVIDIFG